MSEPKLVKVKLKCIIRMHAHITHTYMHWEGYVHVKCTCIQRNKSIHEKKIYIYILKKDGTYFFRYTIIHISYHTITLINKYIYNIIMLYIKNSTSKMYILRSTVGLTCHAVSALSNMTSPLKKNNKSSARPRVMASITERSGRMSVIKTWLRKVCY